jgi:hypothetical protein
MVTRIRLSQQPCSVVERSGGRVYSSSAVPRVTCDSNKSVGEMMLLNNKGGLVEAEKLYHRALEIDINRGFGNISFDYSNTFTT